MPGVGRAFAICTNNSLKTKIDNPSIIYHRFLQDQQLEKNGSVNVFELIESAQPLVKYVRYTSQKMTM